MDFTPVNILTLNCAECKQDFEYRSTSGGRPKLCDDCKAETKGRAQSAIRSRIRAGVYVESPSGLVGVLISRNRFAPKVTVKLENGVIIRLETRVGPCES